MVRKEEKSMTQTKFVLNMKYWRNPYYKSLKVLNNPFDIGALTPENIKAHNLKTLEMGIPKGALKRTLMEIGLSDEIIEILCKLRAYHTYRVTLDDTKMTMTVEWLDDRGTTDGETAQGSQ